MFIYDYFCNCEKIYYTYVNLYNVNVFYVCLAVLYLPKDVTFVNQKKNNMLTILFYESLLLLIYNNISIYFIEIYIIYVQQRHNQKIRCFYILYINYSIYMYVCNVN